MSGARRIVAAATLGALASHALPWASANGALRRRYLPRLAGLGSADTVAITFDDGPDPASTPAVLDELARLGWPATFFLLGTMTRRHADVARQVVAAGHEVAVHGDVHRSHVLRTPFEVARDVQRAHAVIASVTEAPVRFFRPPYGSLSAGSLVAARRCGLEPVLWSAWGKDWQRDATPSTITAELRRSLGRGATVLLHDSDCTSAPQSWKATVASLRLLADDVERLALRPVTLSDHLGPRRAA